jgi:hypothetical protein
MVAASPGNVPTTLNAATLDAAISNAKIDEIAPPRMNFPLLPTARDGAARGNRGQAENALLRPNMAGCCDPDAVLVTI